MDTTTAEILSTARAAHAALETALDAMNELAGKDHFDYTLIHDMTARRDGLHWRIEKLLADDGDEAALARINRASEPRPRY